MEFIYDTGTADEPPYKIIWRYWGDQDVLPDVNEDAEHYAQEPLSPSSMREMVESADVDEDELRYLAYDPESGEISVETKPVDSETE